MGVVKGGLILILVLLVVAPAATASPNTRRADRALDAALEALVDEKQGPPGAIAVVQRGNRRNVHTAGVREVGGSAPRGRQYMRLASTSKAFSGATALALVERRELRLDDTVGEVLPFLTPKWADVTLRQLLDHTSGIPSFTKDPQYLTDIGLDLTGGPPNQLGLVEYVDGEDLEFEPGTDYEYSNTDNIIIALMAEEATGRTYRRNMQRLIFGPLDLDRTSLPKSATLPTPFIHGYDVAPPPPPEDISEAISSNWTGASGGMVSSPFELNDFGRGYVGGELFSGRVQRRQLKTVEGSSEPPGPGTNRAGLGVFEYKTNCGKVYGHTGNFPGYTQFFASTLNGRRSVTVSATEQLSPDQKPDVFRLLRRADAKAVCAALAR